MSHMRKLKNPKTTLYGGVGESLTGIAGFLPPPFNLIVMGVGALSKILGWVAAQDAKVQVKKPA